MIRSLSIAVWCFLGLMGAGGEVWAVQMIKIDDVATKVVPVIGDRDWTRMPVGAAGDVNGDGYADIVISEPNNNDQQPRPVYVHIIYSRPNFDAQIALAKDADVTLSAPPCGLAAFGEYLSRIPFDWDGDGLDDIIFNDEQGIAALYTPCTGLELRLACRYGQPGTYRGPYQGGISWQEGFPGMDLGRGGGFGWTGAMTCLGDISGNGKNIFSIYGTAAFYNPSQDWWGAIWLESGVGRIAGDVNLTEVPHKWNLHYISSQHNNVGDVNKDDIDDYSGIYAENGPIGSGIVFGRKNWPDVGLGSELVSLSIDQQRPPYSPATIDTIGVDLLGDGNIQVIYGDYGVRQVRIIPYAMLRRQNYIRAHIEAPVVINVGRADDYLFGGTLLPAGDVNRDGCEDFWAEAHGSQTSQLRAGRVYLFLGRKNFLVNPPRTTNDADLCLYSERQDNALGAFMVNPGDVNGDGVDDAVFSGFHAAYIYFPFLNKRPSSVHGLKVAPDAHFTTLVRETQPGRTLWFEISGTDQDPEEVNVAEVLLRSQGYLDRRGLKVRLYETGKSTGVFRGKVRLTTKSANQTHRRMRVLPEDLLQVQSVENLAMGRAIPIHPLPPPPVPTPMAFVQSVLAGFWDQRLKSQGSPQWFKCVAILDPRVYSTGEAGACLAVTIRFPGAEEGLRLWPVDWDEEYYYRHPARMNLPYDPLWRDNSFPGLAIRYDRWREAPRGRYLMELRTRATCPDGNGDFPITTVWPYLEVRP